MVTGLQPGKTVHLGEFGNNGEVAITHHAAVWTMARLRGLQFSGQRFVISQISVLDLLWRHLRRYTILRIRRTLLQLQFAPAY